MIYVDVFKTVLISLSLNFVCLLSPIHFFRCRDYDPPTEQPHFTSHAIKATLDYLTKCHDGSNNTLVSILCKRKVYLFIFC